VLHISWLGTVGSTAAVLVMLLAASAPNLGAGIGTAPLLAPPSIVPGRSVAPLAAAATSLERGGGPAQGLSLRCEATSATAGTCSRSPKLQPASGPDWSPLSPPVNGFSAAFAYDATDGYAVLFGGNIGPYWVSDATWVYEAGIWKNITGSLAVLPPARANTSLAYDPNVGGVVLFGGTCAVVYTCLFNDTWAFAHGAWENLTAAAPNATNTPGARQAESLAFDATPGSGLVLFGGWSYSGGCPSTGSTGICKDTWVFNQSWSEVTTTTAPTGRYEAPMTWDPNLGADLLFGGISCFTFPPCPLTSGSTYLGDTWSYAAGTWTDLTPSSPNATNTPPARTGAALAFDPTAGGSVLVAGRTATRWLTDTWVYAGGAWTNLSLNGPAQPAPQFLAAATYDVDGGQLVLAGGSLLCPASSCAPSWTFNGERWAGVGAAAIGVGTGQGSMAYDAHDGYVVTFGGPTYTGFDQGTWRYSGGVWTNLTPSPINATNSPSARTDASMAYDAADGYVVLFSGDGCPLGSGQLCRDTWKFADGSWTNISAPTITVSNTPPGRNAASMAYDSADQYVVLFGGNSNSGLLRDTWSFQAGNWTERTPANLTGTDSPSARDWAAMADDPGDGYLLLLGGYGNCPSNVCNDTWTFSAGSWSQLGGLSLVPPARYGATMSYDSADGYVLLHGGNGYACPSSGGLGYCQDTWSFSAGQWSQVSATSIAPALYLASMVDDAHDGYVLLQGGSYSTGTSVLTDAQSWAYVSSVALGTPTVHPASGDVGGNFTFHVTVAGGGNGSYALRWQGLPSGCAPAPALLTFNCSAATGGAYTVRALVNDSSGVSGDFSSWVTFTVGPAPALGAPTASRSSVDVGQSVEFTSRILAPGLAPDTVRWSWSPALGCANVPGLSLNCTASAPGTGLLATATLTDGSGFATHASSGPVTAFADPVVTASVNLSSTDVGIPVNWSASVVGGSGGIGFQWTGLPAGCPSVSAASISCVPSSAAPLSVTVVVLDSNGGTNQSTAPTVHVTADPVVRLVANRTSITLGDRVTLVATASNGAPPFVYTWSADGLPFLNRSASATTSVVPGAVGTVAYAVEVVDTAGGSVSSAVVNVTVQEAQPTNPHHNPGQGSNGTASGVPLWEIGVLVAVVAAALIAGGVLLMRRQRASGGQSPDGGEPPADGSSPEPEESDGPP
jgi:hypothetical protein